MVLRRSASPGTTGLPRLGIDLPQIHPEPVGNGAEIGRFASRAEQLGFDACWVHEGPTGPVPSLEPLTVLAFAAAFTRRLRLGTAVVLGSLRLPLPLARSLATLDRLSEGRLIAGLALGPARAVRAAYGVHDDRPGQRFEELLQVLRAAWAEDPVDHRGRRWDVTGLSVQPKPLQRPGPPLWLGGRSAAALSRAAAVGQGWIGSGASSMDEFIADIGRLEAFLADVGRTADEMAIARRCYVVLDDEPDVARTRHADWFEAAYGDASLVDAALVTGSIDDIRDVLQRLADAGVTDVILSPLERIDEHLESLSRLLYTSQK